MRNFSQDPVRGIAWPECQHGLLALLAAFCGLREQRCGTLHAQYERPRSGYYLSRRAIPNASGAGAQNLTLDGNRGRNNE